MLNKWLINFTFNIYIKNKRKVTDYIIHKFDILKNLNIKKNVQPAEICLNTTATIIKTNA